MCCFTIDRFCCMRLPTAGVFIGWVCTKVSVIQLIICIVILDNRDEMIKAFGVYSEQTYTSVKTGITVVVSVYLAVGLLNLLASVMLIIGTKKNSHLMLLPWLINNGINLVFKIIFGFALVMYRPFGDAVLILIILGIYCWVWSAIYSLFQSIRTNRGQMVNLENRNSFSSKIELLNNSEVRY